MAWEDRAGRRYYYRVRKVGGRVVKEYVGSGPAAVLVASQDEAERAKRRAKSEAARSADSALEAAENGLASLCYLADSVTRETLILAGYHQHDRGEWRRQRGQDASRRSGRADSGS